MCVLANFIKEFLITHLGVSSKIGLESSKFESSLLKKVVGCSGYEKVDVLDKKRWECQFTSESEQDALPEGYKMHSLAFFPERLKEEN